MAEAEPLSYEYLGTEETLAWLSFIGNDERKLLAMLALNEQYGPLTGGGLQKVLNSLASETLPGERNTFRSYFKNDLVKIGAVVEADTEIQRGFREPEIVNGFEITPLGRRFGVPFAGALLGWSAAHPNVSLRQLLGGNGGGNDIKSPLHRYWILYDLATSPDDPRGPSISHLARTLTPDGRIRQGAVERLEQFGIVSRNTTASSNDRQFSILNPEYITGPKKRPFDSLKPETQLTFSALARAAIIKDIWAVDEFTQLMESIAGPDALEIVARAKHNLCHSFIPGDPFLKHNIEDYSGTQFDGGGKVELKDGATEATTSLIGVIDSFCGGKPGTLERGQQQAENISGSPTTIAELYKKAFSNSNYTSEDANIDSTIRKIIIDADQTQLTAQQVKDVYSQRSGRKVTLPVIQASLGRLLEQGGITIERRALSVRNRRKVGFYAVAGSGEK